MMKFKGISRRLRDWIGGDIHPRHVKTFTLMHESVSVATLQVVASGVPLALVVQGGTGQEGARAELRRRVFKDFEGQVVSAWTDTQDNLVYSTTTKEKPQPQFGDAIHGNVCGSLWGPPKYFTLMHEGAAVATTCAVPLCKTSRPFAQIDDESETEEIAVTDSSGEEWARSALVAEIDRRFKGLPFSTWRNMPHSLMCSTAKEKPKFKFNDRVKYIGPHPTYAGHVGTVRRIETGVSGVRFDKDSRSIAWMANSTLEHFVDISGMCRAYDDLAKHFQSEYRSARIPSAAFAAPYGANDDKAFAAAYAFAAACDEMQNGPATGGRSVRNLAREIWHAALRYARTEA